MRMKVIKKPDKGDEIISIARNEEKDEENPEIVENQESSEFDSKEVKESQEINESHTMNESSEDTDNNSI